MDYYKIYIIKFLGNNHLIAFEAKDNQKFSEIIDKYFEIRTIDRMKLINKLSFELNSTGIILDWSCTKTIKELDINDQNYILVLDTTLNGTRADLRNGDKDKKEIELYKKNEIIPEILNDMALLSDEFINNIAKFKDDENYISYNKIPTNENEYFLVLRLIAKFLEENLHIKVFIDTRNPNFKNDYYNLQILRGIRYIANGLISKSKNIIIAQESEDSKFKNDTLNSLNDIKSIIFKKKNYSLNKKNFDITYQIYNNQIILYLSALIESDNLNYDKDLLEIMNNTNLFIKNNYIFDVIEPLMHTILLSTCIFNDIYIKKYKNNISYEILYYLNKKYTPPYGWKGYIIYNEEFYANENNCLYYSDDKWSIGYICLRDKEIEEIQEKIIDEDNLNNKTNNKFKRVGFGVIIYEKSKYMEIDAKIIEFQSKKYKIGFIVLIKNDAIRIPKTGEEKYRVVSGTNEELRPISILLKEIDT